MDVGGFRSRPCTAGRVSRSGSSHSSSRGTERQPHESRSVPYGVLPTAAWSRHWPRVRGNRKGTGVCLCPRVSMKVFVSQRRLCLRVYVCVLGCVSRCRFSGTHLCGHERVDWCTHFVCLLNLIMKSSGAVTSGRFVFSLYICSLRAFLFSTRNIFSTLIVMFLKLSPKCVGNTV